MDVPKEVKDHRAVGVLLVDKNQRRVVPHGNVQGPSGIGIAVLRSQDPLQDSFHEFIQIPQQMLDFGILEGAGVADGDGGEVHGLEAEGEGHADLPAQVGPDEDAPLPADQGGEEQRDQEPHGLLLGPLADDALGAVGVGVVTVPHQQLLV